MDKYAHVIGQLISLIHLFKNRPDISTVRLLFTTRKYTPQKMKSRTMF